MPEIFFFFQNNVNILCHVEYKINSLGIRKHLLYKMSKTNNNVNLEEKIQRSQKLHFCRTVINFSENIINF